jgi:predicted nucleic acid-binding Zn ribbon protein
MTTPTAASHPICTTCGTPIEGRFCSGCGAAAEPGACVACRAMLSPGAKFCHRCGTPAGGGRQTGRREMIAWAMAGAAVVVAVAALAFRFGSTRPTVPAMANAGNASAASPLASRAPDISQMTPRERFDRLFDRVMGAAERGDTATVSQFSPMALGAYGMLDRFDADARYHAAMIHLTIGEVNTAKALADTIQKEVPNHLFGYLIRGEAADKVNDLAALNASYRAFLGAYDAQIRADRIEYREHQTALDDFRTRARATIEK